ncbi:hypothetical protein IWQ60_010110 [Tieghemiomyces parasiticus]|uniref:Uncharacterized protein n=1 Tax=Tieghemiomyces parasiticus TaxID=78921 RepID=A0A9W7ZTY0_9FUNG|nr:hypothetical protein IWQ60_010110 [Tieghemiomyces parasiticus]
MTQAQTPGRAVPSPCLTPPGKGGLRRRWSTSPEADNEVLDSYHRASRDYLLMRYAQAWQGCTRGLAALYLLPGSPLLTPQASPPGFGRPSRTTTFANAASIESWEKDPVSGDTAGRDEPAMAALSLDTSTTSRSAARHPTPRSPGDPTTAVASAQQWWVLYLTLVGTLLRGDATGALTSAPAYVETLAPSPSPPTGSSPSLPSFTAVATASSPSAGVYSHDIWTDERHRHHLRQFFAQTPSHLDEVWEALLTGYGGAACQVPGEVMVAALLLALQYGALKIAVSWSEVWYASLPDRVLDLLESPADNVALDPASDVATWYAAYEQVTELYVLHALPRSEEWAAAESFVEYSQILRPATKVYLTKTLKVMRQRQRQAAKKAKRREERRKADRLKAQQQQKSKAAAEKDGSTSPAGIQHSTGPEANQVRVVTPDQLRDLDRSAERVVLSRPTTSTPSHRSKSTASAATTPLFFSPAVVAHYFRVFRRILEQQLARRGHFLIPILVAVLLAVYLRRVLRASRWSMVLRPLLAKLWQTIVMGTTVTF